MQRRVTRLSAPHSLGGYDEIVDYDDGRRLYLLSGSFHRLDGPAFVGADGSTVWHDHGREHRVDGPAVEFPDGQCEYWIDGSQLSKEDFLRRP